MPCCAAETREILQSRHTNHRVARCPEIDELADTGRAIAVATRRTAADQCVAAAAAHRGDPRTRQPALAPERRAQPHRRAARAPAARRSPTATPPASPMTCGACAMKQMEVTIMGQSYVLGCPEGGETGAARGRRPGRPRDERDPRRRQGAGARDGSPCWRRSTSPMRWPRTRRARLHRVAPSTSPDDCRRALDALDRAPRFCPCDEDGQLL